MMVRSLHLFLERTVSPTHLPNSPEKSHSVFANMPRISIMTHQSLFAKNITQIAQRIKLLSSNLHRNLSPFLGNTIALDNDGSDPQNLSQSGKWNEQGNQFLCVRGLVSQPIRSSLGIKPIFNAPFDKNT